MADVLTFARDMVFTSKIREVARQLGVNVAAVRDPAGLPPKWRPRAPAW